MSTSEEVLHERPDPLKVIDEFKAAHQDLLTDGLNLYGQPSSEALIVMDARVQASKAAARAIEENGFFADFGNVLYLTASIEAVVESGRELTKKASEIQPNVDFDNFIEGINSVIEFLITRDEEIDIKEGELPTGHEELPAEVVVAGTFDTYRTLIDQFEGAILSSERVSRHIDSIKEVIDKRESRRHSAKLYGSVALAAFAGTFLANKLNRP